MHTAAHFGRGPLGLYRPRRGLEVPPTPAVTGKPPRSDQPPHPLVHKPHQEADQVYKLGAMRVPAAGLPISKPQLVIERHCALS